TVSASSRNSPPRWRGSVAGSTKWRSPIMGADMTRARRSHGKTASPRSGASSGTASTTRGPALPVYVVILAGGTGTPLWPRAPARAPKPFLPFIEGRSLFRRTVERILPLVDPGRILVVAGPAQAPWVRRQAPELPRANLLIEEIGRNTAVSVAL